MAALFWAVSSVIFRKLGRTIRPVELNLLKGVLAIVLLAITMQFSGEKTAPVVPLVLLLLAISGALGIGFGDTMYFEALNSLGPRRTLLLGILAPPLTAVMAAIFLQEELSAVSWLGILLTIAGVAWVITEKHAGETQTHSIAWAGILFGFLAAFSQAAGAVISRWVLTQTTMNALQTALVRLIAGCLFLVIWILLGKQKPGQWIKPNSTPRFWLTVLLVVVIGTYLAIWLQQVSFQYTQVGIAQTLLSTSPLFILPIAAILGEKISLRAVSGVLISTAGIILLFLVG